MTLRTRWVAGLLAGLGSVVPVLADSPASDLGPAHRYETVLPNGSRRTVIDIVPTAEAQDPPMAPPPSVPSVVLELEANMGGEAGMVLWAEAEYLQWWYRGGALPPLVTAGSFLDPIPGALAQPGASVIFGGTQASPQWAGGGRARFGGFFNNSPIGWEVGGFYTIPQVESAGFGSNAVQILSRPFFDSFLITPSSLLFGAADAFEGTISTRTRTTFWGGEANVTAALDTDGTNTAFVGYRYLQMTDELDVAGRFTLGAGGLAFTNGIALLPGAAGLIEDRVRTHNEFHGAQFGWKYHRDFGRLAVDVRASLAVGVGSERIHLEGANVSVDADGFTRTASGGLLVQPSNGGVFGRDMLTVVPEAAIRVSYAVLPGLSLHAGYDFLYWASVARAGDQLDSVVDTRQAAFSGAFTGTAGFRPVSPLRDTAFWAHGLSVGVRLQY